MRNDKGFSTLPGYTTQVFVPKQISIEEQEIVDTIKYSAQASITSVGLINILLVTLTTASM